METDKMTNLPIRYFKVQLRLWHNGFMIVCPGREVIEKRPTGDVNITVGFKSISPDDNGIVATNDPEVIAWIYDPNTPSFLNEKGDKINELFIGESYLDTAEIPNTKMRYCDYYKVDIAKNKDIVKEAVEKGLYKFSKKPNLKAYEISLFEREKEIELRKREAELIINEENLRNLEEKAESIKKSKRIKKENN